MRQPLKLHSVETSRTLLQKDEQYSKENDCLSENRISLGRATFLPLTSVTGKDNSKQDAFLKEEGVIGKADTLVNT